MKIAIIILCGVIVWSILGLFVVTALRGLLHPRRLPSWAQLIIAGPIVWALEFGAWLSIRHKF